jgi:mutator protein MutT
MQRGIDYIGIGVGAIILNQNGQMFLAQRGPLAKNERGCWEFPGGSVEFGETLSAALKREMKEEFGIDIEIGDLLDIADHILPDEGQHWVSPTFLCSIHSGEPQIQEAGKCSAIGWFNIDEMPQPLSKISSHNLTSYRHWLVNHQPQYNA